MRHRISIDRRTGAAAVLGFAALSAQMLFFRECVAVFHGNELTLGGLFAVWLFWTASGAVLPQRTWKRPVSAEGSQPIKSMRPLFCVLAALIPATDLAIRSLPLLLRQIPGETPDLFPTLAAGFLVFAPFGLCSGFIYAALCTTLPRTTDGTEGSAPALYAFESAGSAVAGVICSLLLFRMLPPFTSAVILAVLTAGASFIVLNPGGTDKNSGHQTARIPILTIAAAALLVIPSNRFQESLDRSLWAIGELLDSKSTAYGVVAAARLESQITFYENAIPLFSVPDALTAEESVHPALLQHPAPRSVLIIGGGPGGSVPECLKHPSVTDVQAVELDPGVIAAARSYLPDTARSVFRDPRVTFHVDDGRRFLRRTEKRFDAILMNLPDPCTIQLNRFYSVEFFRLAAGRLNRGGVFSFSLPSSENRIGGELSDILSAAKAGLSAVFPKVVMLPGDRCRFIASADSAYPTGDPSVLAGRIRERGLDSRLLYIRPYFMDVQWSQSRRAFLESRIREVPPEKWNRDFRPLAYWRGFILWAGRFAPALRGPLNGLSAIPLKTVLAACLVAAAAAALLFRRRKSEGPALFLAVWTAGCTGLSLELTALFAYQTLFGVLARDMALIVAGFMTGLGLGAASSARGKTGKAHITELPKLHLSLIVTAGTALASAAVVPAMAGFPDSGIGLPAFALLNAASGFVCGRTFGLANRPENLRLLNLKNPAAALYAIDLAGSMAGALACASLAIPLLGVTGTYTGIAGLNLFTAVAIRAAGRRS
jgi:spermidine synthase